MLHAYRLMPGRCARDFHAMRHLSLRLRRIARYRWPLVITGILVIAAVFSLPPLVDPANPGALVTAALRTSMAYQLVAPFSDVLDALSLLSPSQYAATLALSATFFLGFCLSRRSRPRTRFVGATAIRDALRFIGGIIVVVGVGLLASRPMASLVLSDPDLIAVDFHSHTAASHDGRAGFSAERNREWHSSSGYNAAYVTDHNTFDGALEGALYNPARSGDGTVLLAGVELRDGDEHPLLLGVDPKRMRITSPDWKDAAVEADGGPTPPIILLSMPGNIRSIPSAETDGLVRLAGIEISDGSPRGLAQSARDRDAIMSIASARHLALVSGSDNHGWGRTAPAWSVLRIPGWREMTPADLDIAIRGTIISKGPSAVQVIARRTASPPTSNAAVPLSGMMVGVTMLRTMNAGDRLSWITWSWSLCLVSMWAKRKNRRLRWSGTRKRVERKARPLIDAAA